MKTLIIDDERSNLENLAAMLARYCPAVNVIGSATDVNTAEKIIGELDPDLMFLDIQLAGETGFDLLERLQNRRFDVIFVTAHDRYGIRAIKAAALDYLLKPVDIAELQHAVAKAAAKIARRNDDSAYTLLLEHLKQPAVLPSRIALPLLHETLFVDVNDIMRCEADNTYTWVHVYNGDKILVSRILKEYAEILAPHGFIRTHQSHLVNPRFVKSWLKEDGGTLLMKDLSKVAVSKPNRDKVRATLTK